MESKWMAGLLLSLLPALSWGQGVTAHEIVIGQTSSFSGAIGGEVKEQTAGAMGKPVWILLTWEPDWRWLLGRDDSPWYPSARLFRQPALGDWDRALAALASALAARP